MAKKKAAKAVRSTETGTDLLDLLASGVPPAFATDSEGRIVFWNHGAEELFGQPASRTLGKSCFSVIDGRDIFGNRFCYRDCAVITATRDREPVRGYELNVVNAEREAKCVNVTVVQIPGRRPETFTIVHMLQPIDHGSRLASVIHHLEAPKTSEILSPIAVIQPEIPEDPPLTEREREILRASIRRREKELLERYQLPLTETRVEMMVEQYLRQALFLEKVEGWMWEKWSYVTIHLALEGKPDFAAAYNNLGAAYGAQGNYSDAIAAWQSDVRLDPNSPAGRTAQANLEIARARLKAYPMATRCLLCQEKYERLYGQVHKAGM